MDDANLEGMCEHVVYEAEMLRKTTELLNDETFLAVDATGHLRAEKIDRDVTLHNAVFEASLVHLRALDDFLGKPHGGYPDDVFATNYLSSWSNIKVLSRAERDYVNKRTAHITTLRLEGTPGWPTRRSGDALMAFGRFMLEFAAAHPQREMWFARHILPY
jgi:hypothetical protein